MTKKFTFPLNSGGRGGKGLSGYKKSFILFGGSLSRNVVSGPEVVEIKDSTYQGSKPNKKK